MDEQRARDTSARSAVRGGGGGPRRARDRTESTFEREVLDNETVFDRRLHIYDGADLIEVSVFVWYLSNGNVSQLFLRSV